MKERLLKFINKKRQKGSTVLEFLVVFILLMVFLVFMMDLGLFFRQIYLVQTVSDEVIATLETRQLCSQESDVSAVLNEIAGKYYNRRFSFTTSGLENGFFNYRSDSKYSFSLSCRKPSIPDSLSFSHKYNGLLIFPHGKVISSYYSSNTSFY